MRYLLSFLVFCLCIQTLQAQEHYDYRCLYKLNYQPDSLNMENIKQATLVLLINSESQQSLFEPTAQLNYDAAVFSNPANAENFPGSSKYAFAFTGTPSYAVYKKTDKLITDDYIHYDFYEYQENKSDIKWTILNDTASISNLLCQKAECDFGNRHWIAWFATSLPFSDGPYKFCGLPGLIIKISDSKNSYDFSLISIVEESVVVHKQQDVQPLKVSKAAFFKALNYYFNYPFESAQVGPNAVHFISGQDVMKKNVERLAGKINNWIENYRKGKENN